MNFIYVFEKLKRKALQKQCSLPPVITGIDLKTFEKSLENKLKEKGKE